MSEALTAVWDHTMVVMEKHGFSAVFATVFFVVIVIFLLYPQAQERQLLLNAMTSSIAENQKSTEAIVKSMESIAKSSNEIAHTTAKTDESLQRLNFSVEQMNNNFTAFTKEVSKSHPLMQKTADEILKNIENIKTVPTTPVP